MAYAALVSLEQTLPRILNHDRHPTSPQQKHHLASLDRNVISFQAFLHNFPKEAKNLESQIRDAATAAEDIIECFMLDQILLVDEHAAGIKFEHELGIVAEIMEAIAAEVTEIKLDSVMTKEVTLSDSSIASSSSAVLPAGKINMVGFDDNLFEIKGRLVGEPPKLQYLAVSGMGGIGKTTLARNAYDDRLIQERFDIRAWVTISQDYRAREILSGLLDSMKEFNQDGSEGSFQEMANRIHKILYHRRYLIVMDDIWSTEVLDDLRHFFPNDCNGSRIMLTTRLFDVAGYADSSPYKMPLMDEEKSWDLLKQKIGRDILSDELEKIGHDIARSCRGLPLAVVVVAGILSSIGENRDSWAEVAQNIKKATSKDDRMEEIVSLGYNRLPHRLRACLLYMGLLPEDYSIRVSLLVKLWIAEGFLKHPDDDSPKSLEEDAEEYLEDLVRRNLILVTKRRYNGKIKRCSLHDMVRETCRKMLEKEKYLRHVTSNDDQDSISKRSILRFPYDIEYHVERFRLLRVLHVPNFEYYSSKMLKLYLLRHLCFNRFELLPSDLSNFLNLQSLIIGGGNGIKLPSSIWKLRQLRHLFIVRGCLAAPDDATSALENLQTLKEVEYFFGTNYILQNAPNLVKLGLVLFPYVEEHMSLVCLRQLEELKISFTLRDASRNHFSPVFPRSLKKFTLDCGRASVSLLEAIGSLPNLEVLKLRYCIFDDATWEVRKGEFPRLKILQLIELQKIRSFYLEETALRMLSCLRINRCYHLEELAVEIGDIPMLELIEVSYSGKGVCNWARQVEEEQLSVGNETLQVRCVEPEPGMLPRMPRQI